MLKYAVILPGSEGEVGKGRGREAMILESGMRSNIANIFFLRKNQIFHERSRGVVGYHISLTH